MSQTGEPAAVDSTGNSTVDSSGRAIREHLVFFLGLVPAAIAAMRVYLVGCLYPEQIVDTGVRTPAPVDLLRALVWSVLGYLVLRVLRFWLLTGRHRKGSPQRLWRKVFDRNSPVKAEGGGVVVVRRDDVADLRTCQFEPDFDPDEDAPLVYHLTGIDRVRPDRENPTCTDALAEAQHH